MMYCGKNCQYREIAAHHASSVLPYLKVTGMFWNTDLNTWKIESRQFIQYTTFNAVAFFEEEALELWRK